MRTDWQEHIGVGERQAAAVVKGRTHLVPVHREDDGRLAGHQKMYSGSDRMDAIVRPDAISIKAKLTPANVSTVDKAGDHWTGQA